jgi:hypothetical protein
MSMEDIMKALMQSAAAQQPPKQTGGGGDAMSQILGGMLGGGQQQSGSGGDMLSQALGGLLGGSQQGSAGGNILSQALGGLLGGQQSGGGAGTGALLGGLQQIIGGTPGTGQQLPTGGGSMGLTASNPMMALLQPVVNQVAAKLGISPQVASIISSIALHYLVQSHPNTPGASPLNLGSVMQTLAAGRKVSPSALQKSGMVGDVMQATGMDEKQAVKSLHTTFSVLGEPVKSVKGKATVKRAPKKR